MNDSENRTPEDFQDIARGVDNHIVWYRTKDKVGIHSSEWRLLPHWGRLYDHNTVGEAADMSLDRIKAVVLLAFPTEEKLQHDIHCLVPKSREGDTLGNPDRASYYGVGGAGTAFRSHRNWVLLPHVGATCLDWAPRASIALSNEASLAGNTRDSRR